MSRNCQAERVRVPCRVETKTDRAVLAYVPSVNNPEVGIGMWIPRSQIHGFDEKALQTPHLDVTFWYAQKRGLTERGAS